MKNLRYDLIGAHMSGEKRHAQEVMQVLGITYQHSTPQSISDTWWFWNCENIPEELPIFIGTLKTTPNEAIGRGLSEADAKAINDRARHRG